jgi:acyl carrier protein
MQASVRSNKRDYLPEVIDVLRNITVDFDLDFTDEITSETRLVQDLYFTSLDVVQLVVALEDKYGRQDLPFEKLLMKDGKYVEDLSVAELGAFLETWL